MGVEPYLITSTVECLIAQRLVRVICQKCKKEVQLTTEMIKDFGEHVHVDDKMVFYEGEGCEECQFTGYKGRKAIYEILVFNEDIRQLIINRATANEIKELAMKSGMKTLFRSGWEKVVEGITSPQEVLRVTKEEAA